MGAQYQRYQRYITSPAWRAFRLRYFATHAKRCAACDATKRIHLHHHTYERLGCEKPTDVVPLCQDCHRLVHEYHRSKPWTLTKATFAAIEIIQAAGSPAETEKPTRKPRRKRTPRATRQASRRGV